MSFQIIRIIKISLIFTILGCSTSKSIFVSEVLIAIPVNDNFYYSDESDYEINNQKYSLRFRAEYEKGNLVSFKRYMPEGIIDYSLDDLKADTAILSSLDIPFSQNWVINSDLILTEGDYKKKLKKLDTKHFIEDAGRMIFLIKE